MKCSLGISDFLEEISGLSHSVIFLYFFALIAKEDFLIYPCYSLELCIQMLISFRFSFAFRFSFFHSYLIVTQLCPTLDDPMDYTVHGILQARILEWVDVPFSRGSSKSRDWTKHSCIAGRFFTRWAMREGHVQIVQYISSQEAHLCNLPPGEEAEHSLPSGSARSTLTWSLLTSYHVTTTLTFTTIGYLFFLFLFNFKWRPCVLSDSRMSEGLARWC